MNLRSRGMSESKTALNKVKTAGINYMLSAVSLLQISNI
jgi:hypothetical protein